ncbi:MULTISPECIES: DUF4367 domain-containing protein [unclassified Sedimentibacter]|uniref:DUF4367 domain-containing protein n=1 Tax=unclassified Sedimentibacter TaxID=2649220 RepID=UPI0027E0002A|nr:DUF4367 domain-containing protein [Sedimentibacter sp. MB35-C1]WMJ77478.1 DUF4367 domain-containing protein [Sedimentibacter sp. MB35-C1]
MKSNFNDEYGEILLRKAAILLSEEDKKIYDKLRDDETMANPDQEELDKKILGMIKECEKKEKRKQKQKLIKKLALKAAVLIAVVVVGFAVAFNTVEAFKINVLNFIMEQKEKFSLISLSENNNTDVPAELNEKYYPHYLPEGYEIKSTFINDSGVEISYINKNNEIINYCYFDKDAKTGIDTENRTETSVFINGLNGSIFSKNGHSTLVFKFDEYIFIIEGYIEQEEIIKIAKSITN